MSQLQEYIDLFKGFTPDQRVAAVQGALALTAGRGTKWIPSPGPQTLAKNSAADILLYGGEAAGGKTDLGLGIAFEDHRNSLILRAQYTDLGAITDRAISINGTRAGFNGSSPPKLVTPDGRQLDFGATMSGGTWQGQPHDLIFLDEAAEQPEAAVRFVIGWNRPRDPEKYPNQRCRVVMASNPPLGPVGFWIVEFFAPWLDETYPNPAQQGELRWCVSDEDGKDMWVDGPDPILIDGKVRLPHSRTFIRARIDDNPYLRDNQKYVAMLDSLAEPMRSALRDGNFMLARVDGAFQIVPTPWVRAAQLRWKPERPPGVPQCSLGVDVARGGKANTTLAARYDGWYAPIVEIKGKDTPDGATVAGHTVAHRRDDSKVVVDMGGGYGGAVYEWLRANINPDQVRAYMGSEACARRSKDGKYRFTNTRTAALWLFREALDPGQPGGSPIALPPDPKMVADLTAATFSVTPNGIKAESKEDVEFRLKRSIDHGDAVIMAWFDGATGLTHAPQWRLGQEHGGPAVDRWRAQTVVDFGPRYRNRRF